MNPTTRPLTDTQDRRSRIEGRIDASKTEELAIGTGGAMIFASASDVMEFAKIMSLGGVAIPKFLRENPGACLAVCIQASEWRMSPFAVANKSYSVNDRIAYEAQLVNAVILRRAPIKTRFRISYTGDGDKRKCKVSVVTTDNEEVEYESPAFGTINPKNSPLWKSDPDQQLYYYSSRAMCRRHFPDVLLGVYTFDEMIDNPVMERQATGRVVHENPAMLEGGNPYEKPAPAPEPERFSDLADLNPPAEDVDPMPDANEVPSGDEPEQPAPTNERTSLVDQVKEMLAEQESTLRQFAPKCRALGLLAEGVQLPDAQIESLRVIATNRLAIHNGTYSAD